MKPYNLKRILDIACGLTVACCCGGGVMAQTAEEKQSVTYSNSLNKSAKAAPDINITYPKLTSGYACAGDTILVKAVADDITGLVLPESMYFSGDADGAVVEQTPTSITKRFYTYHPYRTANPTSAATENMSFVIRTKSGSHTIAKDIIAQSCPPTINTPKLQSSTVNGKYNLGYIAFEFSFPNQTTHKDSTLFVPAIAPDQPFVLYLAQRSASNKLEIRYRSIPTSDARYEIRVTYNEGDSIRLASFGPYDFPVAPLNAITPNQSAYCSGEDIAFTLTLADEYDKMLRQTVDPGKPAEIAACFDWSGSPSEVTFMGSKDNQYFFSTKATGASNEYHCMMSVDLRYQSTLNRPTIDTAIHVTYDMPIGTFSYHSSAAFTLNEDAGCEGETFDLADLLPAGLTVVGYNTQSPGPSFSSGSKFTVPGESSMVYAKLKADFHCNFMGADNTFIDSVKINVTPLPEISVGIKHDTLICEGEALLLTAETNPEAKAAVTWIKTTDGSGTESIQPGPYVMYENATITAIATNLCGSSKPASFKVRIGKRPAISFTPSDIVRDCPYTPVSLTGNGGDKYVYHLYDLRAHQAATPPQFGAQTGLQNYPLQLHDSLALVYEAENHLTSTGFQPASLICSASDTALIVAYPLPPVKIAYDGQPPADDGTLCVPRDRSFNLVASGADTYMWQNDPTKSGANYRLTLTQDETIRVRGTERAHGCHADLTVQCVISVEHAGRIKDATVCPDENVCFEADLLPDTKYAWSNPQGTDLNHSAERFCFNPTADPGQTGTYTLTTERKGCREVLTYELTFHPYPTPQIITESPEVCEGSNVVLQVYSGMSEAEEKRATYRWEKADGAFISDRPNFGISGISTGDAGLYRAIVTSQAGCQGQDDITLTVGMHITPDFQIATSYCEDEETTLTASPAGSGYIYRWFTDSRVIPTDETVPTAKIAWQRNDNGTLYLEIQQTGCTDTAFRPLTVIPRPHLSGLPQDTGLCTGLPLCLNPVADLTPDKIVWYFIDADGSKTVLRQDANPDLTYCWNQVDALQNGLYYLDVSHQGCLSVSDTVRLTVYPLPDIRIDGPAFICDGDTVTLAAVSNTQGSNRWSPSGQTTEAIRITEAGRYAVTRTSEYGCADSADIRLEARPLPYFTLPADTSLCRGTSFMIYGPDGMDAYVWHDGLEEKDRLAEDEGWYILTAFRNECGFSDSLYVHLTFCGQFHFPTAFTPNDNRINDTWGAISAAKEEDMAEYDLMVFDRNGKKVFHGKRISEQWDGKYKGQLCPPGVYTYSFRALEKEEGIKYQSSGTVTIVL